MKEAPNHYENSMIEVRLARQEAERLREQLLSEYNRMVSNDLHKNQPDDAQRKRGLEAMRKAILATNRALESIDQALREMERVRD
ncbi:MAG: hypothetical protein AMJ79_06560 [Phycisphaerae bacterium SM23_30]|nr:MAG: hypothetical protein AMJ79_06560 [Phycisphaerae bacterium SM23_30]